MLKVGFFETVITPELGLDIPGYFDRRPADGIKDDLYARAVVFDNGEKRAAMVVLDLCGAPKDLCDAIRDRVTQFTDIPREYIMVSATHTHTGAPRVGEPTVMIAKRAADAVILADKYKTEAVVGTGVGKEEGISFNRRYLMKNGTIKTNPGMLNPNIVRGMGIIDPDVTVMRVDKPCGKPLGVVVNFACHADVVTGTEYSADYIGELSRCIKKALGEDVNTVFINGFCGDINHIDFTGRIDTTSPIRYKQMGRILAGDVLSVRETIKTQDAMDIAALDESIVIKRRLPTAEQLEWSRKVVNGEDTAEVVSLQVNSDADVEFIAAADTHVVDLSYAKDMLKLDEMHLTEADVEVQTIKLGDTAVTAFPGEIFVEIGLQIKAKSPYKYNIMAELANGLHGYIGTKLAHEQGSYEVKLSAYTYLADEAEEKLVTKADEMLKAL